MVFLDDRKDDFFVCIVSLDNIGAIAATQRQYDNRVSPGYAPLDVTTSLILLLILPSRNPQNHPSESGIPLSGFPRGSENKERGQSASHGNPPLKLNPKPRIHPTSSPNPSRDLIDPPEIRVHDVPPGPGHRSSGDLRN